MSCGMKHAKKGKAKPKAKKKTAKKKSGGDYEEALKKVGIELVNGMRLGRILILGVARKRDVL